MRIFILILLLFQLNTFAQKCTDILAINYNQIDQCIYEDVTVSTITNSYFNPSNKLTKLYNAIKETKKGECVKVEYTYTVLKFNTSYYVGRDSKGDTVKINTSNFNNLRFGQVLSETVKAFQMYEQLFESLFPNLDLNFVFKPIELLEPNKSYLSAADIIIEPYKAPMSSTYAITSVGSLSPIKFNTSKPYGIDCNDFDNKISFLRVLIHELGHSFGIKHCYYESKYTGIKDEIMLTKPPTKDEDVCDLDFYENKFANKKFLRIGGDLRNSYVIKAAIYKIYNQ